MCNIVLPCRTSRGAMAIASLECSSVTQQSSGTCEPLLKLWGVSGSSGIGGAMMLWFGQIHPVWVIPQPSPSETSWPPLWPVRKHSSNHLHSTPQVNWLEFSLLMSNTSTSLSSSNSLVTWGSSAGGCLVRHSWTKFLSNCRKEYGPSELDWLPQRSMTSWSLAATVCNWRGQLWLARWWSRERSMGECVRQMIGWRVKRR